MAYNGSKNVAKLWENGNEIDLTDGTDSSVAYGLFVKDGDVYVVGNETKEGGSTNAVLWKNGVYSPLTVGDYYSSAHSVFVEGDNLYAVGTKASNGSNWEATIWKNGDPIPLFNDQTPYAYGYSIFVEGDDVLVAGRTEAADEEKTKTALLWKNGTIDTDFQVHETSNSSGAYFIFVK
jgi:hypothetical protein